ncbi:MAG: protein-S-isoprenylcysteine O-methyltransferase [Pseudomonadota bacterium]
MGNWKNWLRIVAMAAIAVALVWRVDLNGWGSLAWFVLTSIMVVIRTPHAKENAANILTDTRKDTVEKLTLAGMTLSMMILPILALLTGVFRFADYTLPDWLTALGVLAYLGALYLFWRSHADLGRNWSVTLEVREGHTLVSSGVYSRIRHPMYTAIWLFVLIQPLLLHNWIAGPPAILFFAALYLLRIPREEAMMREQFGAAYEEYMKRTKRIIPGVI